MRFIMCLVLAVITFFGLSCFAQVHLGEPEMYAVSYRVVGSHQIGTETVYRKGAQRVTKSLLDIKMGRQVLRTETLTIEKEDGIVVVDLSANKAIRVPLFSAAPDLLDGDHVLSSVSEAHAALPPVSVEEQAEEEMVLGRPCQVSRFEGGALWVWKGLVLKMEYRKDDVFSKREAVTLSVGEDISDEVFAIPEGVQFVETGW